MKSCCVTHNLHRFSKYDFDYKISTYHPKFKNRHMQHGPGCQSYTSRELPNSRRVSILGFLAKCHICDIPQFGQNWGGWRYTKQYIIRRDFHGRLHPKCTLLHTELCRFSTPPQNGVFRILAIFVDFAKLCKFAHFAHLSFSHMASCTW